ncbi:MAG: ROK family protein [Eubacteriales bacterium]|nr:ROK family protein [Eubacteriales bacterium]
MKRFLLAIDAGGTFLKSALFCNGELCRDTFFRVEADSDIGNAAQIRAAYNSIIAHAAACARSRGGRIFRVSVDTPGPFDFSTGTPLMKHKYRAIYGISLVPWIKQAAGDVEVRFVHDSTAFILGVARQVTCRPVAGAMIGTGLGFAMLGHDGRPQTRPDGGPLVSIYQRPLRQTTAEELISGRGIVARYNANAAVPADNAKQIGDRAAAGDGNARRIYLETGELLGEVVRPILLQYGVQAFILGGQISKSFSLMEPGLRQALAGLGQLKYIAAAEDIDNVHLYGAALA